MPEVEGLFRDAMMQLSSGMAIVSGEGQFLKINTALQEMLGYSDSDLCATNLQSILHPDDVDVHLAKLKAILSGRIAYYQKDGRLRRRDGCFVSKHLEYSLVRGSDGSSRYFLAQVRDISARKSAEASRRRAEKQFRLLVQGLKDHAICMLDLEGRVASWNAGAQRNKGYLPEEIIGEDFSRFFTEEEREKGEPQRALEIARRDGRFEGEGWRVRKDGTRFWAHVLLELIRDDAGTAIGFAKITRDITEQKQAVERLEREVRRYHNLLQTATDGIHVLDDQGRLQEANESFLRLIGYSADEALTLERSDWAREDGIPFALPKISKTVEMQLRRKDGGIVDVEVNGRCVQWEGAPVFFGAARNISERKAAQRNLEQALERAEAASRSKSNFLAMISHEIRTPMNGIMGMNSLLCETDLSPHQRKLAETVNYSAAALLTIVDDILDVSKLENGKVELRNVLFSLPRLFDEVIELMSFRAKQKGLSVELVFSGFVPGAFCGDPVRIRQIVLNLVSNAIKFSERGSVEIVVDGRPLGERRVRIRVTVQDRGIGITAEAKSRLFRPFEQADEAIATRFGGTGLGLSICKKLVELMDGEIGVADRAGGGSLFWFEIELLQALLSCGERLNALAAIRENANVTPPIPTPTGAVASGRILLVEDHWVNMELANLILEAAGYKVDHAIDGIAAVNAVRENRYDLILMDMRMPELDGLSATRQIRNLKKGKHVPIVAMTANAMDEDKRRCLEAGMDDYIAKPYEPNKLLDRIALWINSAGSARAASASSEIGSTDAPPAIDGDQIRQLRSFLPLDKFNALLRLQIANAEESLRQLASLKLTMPLDEIGAIAHDMISSFGIFGATQVQRLATDLLSACRAGEASKVPDLIDDICRTSATASIVFQQMLGMEYVPIPS